MPTVLIADDDAAFRTLWAINLAARGYGVMEAADGRACLRLVHEEKPDLILLDLSMPVLSGWEVLESLKRSSGATLPPVIVVTGLSDGDIEARARGLGAALVLFKPLGVDELLHAVDVALGHS